MKTYWDHTEKERANLTHQEVEALCKFELMGEGVVVSPYPGEAPKKPQIDEPKISVYEVEWKSSSYRTASLYFDDRDQALSAMELRPVYIDTDYAADAKSAVPLCDPKLSEHEVYCVFDKDAYSTKLAAYKSAKSAYDASLKEYQEDKAAAERCCESLWEDYSEQRDKLRQALQVADRWADYVATCDGDEDTAVKFLRKAFNSDRIEAANDWCDAGIPALLPNEVPA